MYCNFFGLRSHPFEDRADAQFFYPTAECEETLAAMVYEIQYGTGLGLLIGEAGTGKTLLIRALLQRLQNSDQTVVVTWPPSGAMDLIRECCKGFGVTLPSSHHETRRVSRLRRHLGRSAGAGHRSILILDQAENLSPSNIAQLATLADLSGERGKLLTILLAAQPHVRSLLDRPEFARIRQQLFGERTLSPLTETDTREYVRHRLRIAGAGDADLFDDRAIALIHEISGGIPRLINRISNAAMLTAYGAETPCITRAIVEEATTTRPTVRERAVEARELGLATAGDGGAPWRDSLQTMEADGPRMTADPYESPVADVDTVDDDGVDESWAIANGSSGASIADAAYEGSNGASPRSGPSSGTVLLARLERATARAERMTTTTEASLTRLAAVEKHLAVLVEHADRITESLSPAVQEKIEAMERAERRLTGIASQTERQVNDVESKLARASGVVTQTEDSARRAERACELANDVESRLTAFAERLADKAEEVQQRVSVLMSGVQTTEDAQARLARVIEQATCVTQASENAVHTVRAQVQAAVDEGERELRRRAEAEMERCQRQTQERIKSFERPVLSIVEKTQGKVDALLQRAAAVAADADSAVERHRFAARETVETAQTRVDALLERLSTAAADADEKTHGLTAALQRTIADSEQARQRITAESVEQHRAAMRDQWATVEASAEKAGQAAQAKLDEVVRHAASAAADAERRVEAVTAPLKAAIVEGERFEKQLSDVLPRRCREESDALLEGYRTSLREDAASLEQSAKETLQSAQARLDGVLRHVSAAAIDAEQSVEPLTAKLQAAIEDGERRAKEFSETLPRRCREEIETMTATATARLQQAERQLDTLLARQTDAQSTLSALSADAAARVAELMETVRSTGAAVDDLAAKAQPLTHSLADAVQRGEDLLREVEATGDRVTALRQQVANNLVDIGIGCERVAAVRAQVGDYDQLAAAHERALAAAKQLNAVITSAGELHDALEGLVAHADEKVDRLGSHHAAASHILDRLSAANVTGHQVVERIEKSGHVAADSAAKVQAQIDRLGQDALSLHTMTEAATKQLEDRHKEAAALLTNLTSSSASGTHLYEELGRRIEQAREQMEQITKGAGQADLLVGQLSAITQTLTAAREAGASLHETVEDARLLTDRLSVIGEQAVPQCAALGENSIVARGLIERQEQLREEADATAERLASQLAAAADLAKANQGLLRDFTTHADSLRERIDELAREAADMEARLAVLAAGPTAIVESAQTQAAQLEKVCAAVRKIFANLSEATLKAQQQTEELKGAGADTAGRLAQLTVETERATRTLHVWLEEAVRTQSRLEQTLTECPSIWQTHPTETVRRLSHAASPFARIAADGVAGGLQVLAEPAVAATAVESKIAKTPTRAEEIARLIKEAKREEAAVPT